MRFVLAGFVLFSALNCLPVRAAEDADRNPRARQPRPVTAILSDGRRIFGQVAATTNQERLDLIVASERVQLTAHVAWSQILSVRVRNREVPVARFRQRLEQFVLPEQPPLETDSKPLRIQPLLDEVTGEPAAASRTMPRSVQMNVRLTNWDNDAPPDGLLLELFVLDATGHPTVAPGQLTATLTGLRQQVTGGQSTLNRRTPVAQLERWNIPVRTADFSDGRAVLKLPFRTLRPNQDLKIATETLLEISYGVPSVGVLKASQPDVLIRQPSFFRDELFLSTGDRLLPSEAPASQSKRPLSRDPNKGIFRPTFQVR